MRREWRSLTIIAVVAVVTLTLSGTLQAANLSAVGGSPAPRPAGIERAGFLDLAWDWLAGTWAGLKAVFEQDGAGTNPTTPECVPNTTCGDAGPGIDPEG